jgi:hypothetical protein
MAPTTEHPPALAIPSRDVRYHLEGVATAARTLGRLEPGCRRIGLTFGQFGILELLAHVLRHTGRAEVDLVTWSMRPSDAQTVADWTQRRKIDRLRVLFGTGANIKKHNESTLLPSLFAPDQVRFGNVHAKWFRVKADGWHVVCRSSMNVNRCVRWEQFDLDDNDQIGQWFEDVLDRVWKTSPAPWDSGPSSRRTTDRAAFGRTGAGARTTRKRRVRLATG